MKKNKDKKSIDFVVCWVDGNDPKWLKKKSNFIPSEKRANNDTRFRDWGFFKYWFRSVEENAPWVNKIYLVTDNQIPEFLNLDNPKIVIIDHKDYIPELFLPTFSANVIELNFHRIKNLSNQFVYFNDDTLLNKFIKPTYFFKHCQPRYTYIERKRENDGSLMSFISKNDMDLVNKSFKKRNILIHPFKFINFRYGKYGVKNLLCINKDFQVLEDNHMPSPFLKSTYEEIWTKFNNELCDTCEHKFRTQKDLNQYLFRYYDCARGNFWPAFVEHGGYYRLDTDTYLDAIEDIKQKKHKMVCLNDNDYLTSDNFDLIKEKLVNALEKRYPNKSSFEK